MKLCVYDVLVSEIVHSSSSSSSYLPSLRNPGDPFSNVGILRYFMPDHKHHVANESEEYDYMPVALLSTIIGFGTTALIFLFRSFKDSSFFCNQLVRTSIHDFAVVMSVIIGTVVSQFLFPQIPLEKLAVPER